MYSNQALQLDQAPTMVLSTPDWCDLSRPKPVPAKEKKPLAKAGRESKGAGSRRIFSPVFKLQVLDSYRQDADCQGNQRATARKYGIHRRQIQKWLQMETTLRLSVQKSSAALNLGSAAPRPPESRALGDAAAAPPAHAAAAPPSIPEPGGSGSVSDSDEYVNVDEISDSEEEDAADTCSGCSSPESGEQALDLSSATKRRRFHSADFKAHVLRAFRHGESGCRGNPRATARSFGVHWRRVEKWLKQEVPASAHAAPLASACPDLSSRKRPPEDANSPGKRAKVCPAADELQESALCLVKRTDELAKIEPTEPRLGHYCRILYPAATTLEHSYGSTLGYLKPEYPFCVYQPWQCCYQQILSARSGFDAASAMLGANSKAYSYAFNVKYEASYVDIPVQYGFGDSVPSKWLHENPLFLHGPPSPYPCLQDRL